MKTLFYTVICCALLLPSSRICKAYDMGDAEAHIWYTVGYEFRCSERILGIPVSKDSKTPEYDNFIMQLLLKTHPDFTKWPDKEKLSWRKQMNEIGDAGDLVARSDNCKHYQLSLEFLINYGKEFGINADVFRQRLMQAKMKSRRR